MTLNGKMLLPVAALLVVGVAPLPAQTVAVEDPLPYLPLRAPAPNRMTVRSGAIVTLSPGVPTEIVIEPEYVTTTTVSYEYVDVPAAPRAIAKPRQRPKSRTVGAVRPRCACPSS